MASGKNRNKGFIATAVLYSLVIIISLVLFIILKNLGTTRKIERDTGVEVKGELLYYEIDYNGNGNTSGSMQKERKSSGKNVELAKCAYERVGYSFRGWTKRDIQACDFSIEEEDRKCYADQSSVRNLAPVGTVITLYAQWGANEYTVSFDPNTGTPKPANLVVTYDSRYTSLPSVSKTGYTFKGWYTTKNSGGVKIENSTVVKTPSNHTLYARWEANRYTVSLNAMGGSVSPTTKQVTFDGIYGNLPTPSRRGYTFNGWYTATSGGTKIESGTRYTTAGNQTLYARWTANRYNVYFNPNGGTPTPGARTVTYDGTYGTLPTVSRVGYKFLGWYTAATGGTQISSGTRVSITSNQTLYAHWEAAIKVLYGGNTGQNNTSWPWRTWVPNRGICKSSGQRSFKDLGNQLSLVADRKDELGNCLAAETTVNTSGFTYLYIHAGRRKYSSDIYVDGQKVSGGCDQGDQYITVNLNGRSSSNIKLSVYSGYDSGGCCGGKGGIRVYQIILSNSPLSNAQVNAY